MTRTPWRTDWLETVAAFLLVAASVVAYLHGGFYWVVVWPSSALISALALVASAVVMGNHLAPQVFFRRLLKLVGALVFLILAWIAVNSGSISLSAVFGVMGIFLALAAIWGSLEGRPEKRLPEAPFVLATAVILLVWGAIGLVRWALPAWHVMPDVLFGPDSASLVLSLLALVVGVVLIKVTHNKFSSRGETLLATFLGSAIFAAETAASLMSGQYGVSAVFFTLAIGLPCAVSLTWFTLNCEPESLSHLSDKQLQLYRHRRLGEGIIIIWFAVISAVYVSYGNTSVESFFIAIAGVYLVNSIVYHGNYLKSLTERSHGLILFSYLVAAILTIQATGGFASPFVSIFYALVVSAFIVLSSGWAWAVVVTCVAYLVVSFATTYAAGPIPLTEWLQFLSWTFSLSITGYYGILMLKERLGYETKIHTTTDRLMTALTASSREKDRFEQQAQQFQNLNTELSDTRTALLNVLEDVEEAKLRIERDARRDAAILASLGEGLIAATADRKIFLHNQAMTGLTGLSGSAAVGRDLGEVLRFVRETDNAPDTQMLDAVFTGKPMACPEKLEIIAANGQRLPVAGSAAPFFDEAGQLQGVVVALRDITVQRDANRQRSGFISIASHQLRTPLSTMRWYLDVLLAGDVGAVSKEQADLLSDLQVSNLRMIKLVNDLLDVNRIESGRILPKPAMTAIKPLLADITKDFTALLEKKKQKLETSFADGVSELFIDPEAVRQGTANLLANAINYTPEGGLIRVTFGPVGDEAVIEVKDTGIGVPEESKHRLFSQFFRADNAIATETVGSGLGLYITRLMVEASGGRVWFESKVGGGSQFYIAFPLKLATKK